MYNFPALVFLRSASIEAIVIVFLTIFLILMYSLFVQIQMYRTKRVQVFGKNFLKIGSDYYESDTDWQRKGEVGPEWQAMFDSLNEIVKIFGPDSPVPDNAQFERVEDILKRHGLEIRLVHAPEGIVPPRGSILIKYHGDTIWTYTSPLNS